MILANKDHRRLIVSIFNLWRTFTDHAIALSMSILPTISLEMPVPSQDHYGFHSFLVVD